VYGVEALRSKDCSGSNLSFIRTAMEIAATHHEKFNGCGYPYGLAGKDIPLSGRLMAIIDVYDALVSERVYKPAYSHEEALDLIAQEKGRHFDPDIVDAFFEIQADIKKIADTFIPNRS
jgi:putative two-component system response regulator